MTSKVAGTTMIVAGVLSNFAIRSLMSIVVTHVMVAHIVVAHVSLVVHHSCALVGHRSILARQASFSRAVMSHCRSRCGLVHVSIV